MTITSRAEQKHRHPYYLAPQNVGVGEAAPTSRVATVAVGSDLVVQVESVLDRPAVTTRAERIGTVIRAYDCDGNLLTDLAHVDGDRADWRPLLPLAVDAAVRLFPNHLLTEA